MIPVKKLAFILIALVTLNLGAPYAIAGGAAKRKKAKKRAIARAHPTAAVDTHAAYDPPINLIRAVASGNTAVVKQHTSSPRTDLDKLYAIAGNCLEETVHIKASVLHLAVAYDQTQIIKDLIEAQANINIRDENDATPIHWAARYQCLGAILVLKDLGSNFEALDKRGETALHYAAKCWSNKAGAKLLNNVIKQGITLTFESVADLLKIYGCLKAEDIPEYPFIICVSILLEGGALWGAKNKHGLTPLHLAACADNIKMMRALWILGGAFKINNNKSCAVWFTQVQAGQQQALQELLKFNLDLISPRDDALRTPLHHSAIWGKTLALAHLMDYCKNPLKDYVNAAEPAKDLEDGCKKFLEDFINAQDVQGRTPLHYAARHGHLDIIEILGSTPYTICDLKDNNGHTCLHLAVINNQLQAVKMIMALSDIHKKDWGLQAFDCTGCNALHLAAQYGCLEIVTYFIEEKKFELKTYTNDNSHKAMALHAAARSGNTKVIDALILLGASLDDLCGLSGLTLMHVVVSVNQIDAFNYLNKMYPAFIDQLEVKAQDGSTPLHYAALKANRAFIEILYTCRANFKAQAIDGSTVLHRVIEGSLKAADYTQALKLLVRYGAELGLPNDCGNTPLHCAAILGNSQIINTLLSMNAPLDSVNHSGHTPYVAGLVNNFDHKALLPNNDINKPLGNAFTLLSLAAHHGDVRVLGLLLNLGAKLNQEDAAGLLASERADLQEQQAAVDFFDKQKYNRLLRFAAAQGNHALILKYLRVGADIDSLDQAGNPAIFYAAVHADTETINFLLDQGARPDTLNRNDLTILQKLLVSYSNQHLEFFKQLFELQQDPNRLDLTGQTLLHIAAQYADELAVNYLLNQGFDFEAKDQKGQTVFHKAVQNKNKQVFILLAQFYLYQKEQARSKTDEDAQDCKDAPNTPEALLPQTEVFEQDERLELWNLQDAEGNTPMHLAALAGMLDILELCMEYQLLIIYNNAKQTPLEVALANNQPAEVVHIIKQAMLSAPSFITPSATARPSATIQALGRIYSACNRAMSLSATDDDDEQQNQDTDLIYCLTHRSRWYEALGMLSKAGDDDDNTPSTQQIPYSDIIAWIMPIVQALMYYDWATYKISD